MTQIYLLTDLMDRDTIKKGITDCVTQKRLKPGDRVVVCKTCRLAGVYLQENWSGSCRLCGGTEVMSFPDGMDAVFCKNQTSDTNTDNHRTRRPQGKPPWVPDPQPRSIELPEYTGSVPNKRPALLAGAAIAAVLLIAALLLRGCSRRRDTGGDSSQAQSTESTASSHAGTDAAKAGVFGDANKDGEMNVKDAQAALTAAGDIRIGLTPQISTDGIAAADVDGDGTLTVKDVQYILIYYANTRAEIECSWRSVTGNPNAPAESNLG